MNLINILLIITILGMSTFNYVRIDKLEKVVAEKEKSMVAALQFTDKEIEQIKERFKNNGENRRRTITSLISLEQELGGKNFYAPLVHKKWHKLV